MSEYKLIVAGGREFNNTNLLDYRIKETIANLPNHCQVSIVSGMARGADRLAAQWAKQNSCKLHERPADWIAEPRRGGFIRNVSMAEESDGLLAFWDGKSKGTEHMITTARSRNLFVRIVYYTAELVELPSGEFVTKCNELMIAPRIGVLR